MVKEHLQELGKTRDAALPTIAVPGKFWSSDITPETGRRKYHTSRYM